MSNEFSENTRVKIPALVHLTRLGYQYFSLKDTANFEYDGETNIIKKVFRKQFLKLNTDFDENDFEREFQNISLELGYDDLGRTFYNRLIGKGNSTYKFIDWDNFKNNVFHCCTELACRNGEDEFRPDITVFINGLPLAFIEVKKPNNPQGIKAERDRINDRFRNDKFRKFINITQLLIFSNNMEYDDVSTGSTSGQDQLQGAFYATTAKGGNTKFNNFREELKSELIDRIKNIDDNTENFILKDTNYQTLKYSQEFISNKNDNSPTNRILTSLFTKDRLKMFLQYGIVYVDESDGLQKHIMRYPQFFAAKAIRKTLENGEQKGVIWHTQGSGKTALAYYSVRYLTDYFSKKGIVPKFYFIVDRLDLLKQASAEFKKRGLAVSTVNSKEKLQRDFKKNTVNQGITAVNIQKFNEDTIVLNNSGYGIDVQRIFFIDEAHRSYNLSGSFLPNLYNSDKKSIKIALTGTPLISYKNASIGDEEEIDLTEKNDLNTTRNIFGNYIHKYYYNNSIRDSYTLKLLREEIETSYKNKIKKVIKDVEVEIGTLNKRELYAHERFCEPMLDYILEDFKDSRIRFGDKSIGAMVVCDSSEQARMFYGIFEEYRHSDESQNPLEQKEIAGHARNEVSAALILHNEGDKESRAAQIKDFKDGKIDFLFVYSMLLTGFNAPRLKKMYLGRKIKAHNLLQTLTRVNRPYKDFRMGYVVDFADISKEFDITNRAYFEELNREYDTDTTGENQNDVFGSLFMSKEEIDEKIERIKTILSDYSAEKGDNKELFSQQIQEINDRQKLLELKNALQDARDIYNIARLIGYTELTEQLDIKQLSQLISEVSNRLQLLNLATAMNDVNSRELLNEAIENVVFQFTKIGEEQLNMFAEQLISTACNTRQALQNNFHQKDPEWILLFDDFRRLLQKHRIDETNLDNIKFESQELSVIYDKIKELNRRNNVLKAKFGGDKKFARIYKNIEPCGLPSANNPLLTLLERIKESIDEVVMQNENMLSKKPFFERLVGQKITEIWRKPEFEQKLNADIIERLIKYVSDEYFEEYRAAA